MKSHGGSKRHTPSRQDLPSAEHVLERIKTLTGELEALQEEVYGEIADPAELLDRRSLLEQAGAAGVLVKFKAALDHLRGILWFCESDGRPENHPPHRTERERELARATELLQALARPAASVSTRADSGSFFERLDRVIDTYMQEGSTAQKAGPSKI